MSTPSAPDFNIVPNPLTSSTVVLGWPVPNDAGSPIIDYRLEIKLGEVWTLLKSDITVTQYTYSPTVQGSQYTFRMKARNIFSSSSYTDPVIVTAGLVPNAPVLPSAQVSVDKVIIGWQVSATNGVPITGYKIMIITSDGTSYAEEKKSCDGQNSAIAFAYTCQIPMVNLLASPHNLVQGSTMRIKVIATSANGDSNDSPINSNTILVLVPA